MGLIRISTYAVCRLAIPYFAILSQPVFVNRHFLFYSLEKLLLLSDYFSVIFGQYCHASPTYLSGLCQQFRCKGSLPSLHYQITILGRLDTWWLLLPFRYSTDRGAAPHSLSLRLDRLPYLQLKGAGVSVKCGTPQHSEMFSLHLRVNHAQFFDNAFNWDSACSNIFLLYLSCQIGGQNNRVLFALISLRFPVNSLSSLLVLPIWRCGTYLSGAITLSRKIFLAGDNCPPLDGVTHAHSVFFLVR